MKPIQLFGDGVSSYSQIVTAQRRLNCFFEIRADGDKSQLIIRGTPGSFLWVTLSTNPVRGWKVVGSFLYVVAGSTVLKVATDGSYSLIGTVTSGTNLVSLADNGIELIIVEGTFGWIVTLSSGAIAKITDPNFPTAPTTVSFLNGRFQVGSPGTRQFFVSQSYAGSVWTPAIFATKENSSDNLIAVQVLNGVLLLWGPNSLEFWQDIGASPVPYQRINGSSQTWGLAAIGSKALFNGSLVFLGQNPEGTVQVMRLSGYKPVPISTNDIESILNKMVQTGVGVSDAVALTYMVDGHPMYQLTLPAGGRSFLYDDLSKAWQEVQTGIELTQRHYGNLGIAFNSLNYVSDYRNGNVYQLSPDTYTDNGTPIKRQVISRHIRNAGNPFSIDDLYIDMETGVGLQSGQGSDPKIMMQVSKDGGRTFGIERWKSIGKVGQYLSPRVIWNRLGQAVDFVFKFTMTDPVKFIITSAVATSIDESSDA